MSQLIPKTDSCVIVYDSSEEAMQETTEAFKHFYKTDYIKHIDKSDIIPALGEIYKPNHACIWNSIEDIGKICRCAGYTNKVALMVFESNKAGIYRLEDITKQ